MRGTPALFVDLLIFLFPILFIYIGYVFKNVKKWKWRGSLIMGFGFIVGLFLIVGWTIKFGQYSYLKSMKLTEIDSITIGDVTYSSSNNIDEIVHALKASEWYLSSHENGKFLGDLVIKKKMVIWAGALVF